MSRYIYAEVAYETIEEVEAAVTAMKVRLDNNPTDWCVVKGATTPVTVNGIVGYQYGDPLSDADINALISSDRISSSFSDTIYNVFSINDGYNFTEIAESDVAAKVKLLRASYAIWLNVTKYLDTQVAEGEQFIVHEVTNEDMSSYIANGPV